MITGLAAVAAAYFSIRATRNQQRSSENLEKDRRRAKVEAARLRLPIHLSELIEYSNIILGSLKGKLDKSDTEVIFKSNNDEALEKPPLPESVIQIFADIVENSDDANFSAYLASSVREMQILNSRLSTFLSSENNTMVFSKDLENYAIQAAKIHAYAAGLFDYARGINSQPPAKLNWELVHAALNLNEMWNSDYQSMHEWVARMEARENAAG